MTADKSGGATPASDAEIDGRVSAEVVRALTIANMRDARLVSYVARRMAAEHTAEMPRAKVRKIVAGMLDAGTIQAFDAGMADAAGLGCPCCAGGQLQDRAGGTGGRAARSAELLRPVLSIGGMACHPVAHAAYCLLDAWEREYGLHVKAFRGEFIADLCRRGGYEREAAAEAVRLLVEWRVADERNGVISVNARAGAGRGRFA